MVLPLCLLTLYIHPPNTSTKVNLNNRNQVLLFPCKGFPFLYNKIQILHRRLPAQIPADQPPSSFNTHPCQQAPVSIQPDLSLPQTWILSLAQALFHSTPSPCHTLHSAHPLGLSLNVTSSESGYSTTQSKVYSHTSHTPFISSPASFPP